jgi:type IV pilus biogenesis protein CpaD/CtpE
MYIKTVVVSMAALVITGCTGNTNLQEGWGDATQSYREASIVNPSGQAVTVSTLDGMKANQVVDAYRAESGEMDSERIVTDVGSN